MDYCGELHDTVSVGINKTIYDSKIPITLIKESSIFNIIQLELLVEKDHKVLDMLAEGVLSLYIFLEVEGGKYRSPLSYSLIGRRVKINPIEIIMSEDEAVVGIEIKYKNVCEGTGLRSLLEVCDYIDFEYALYSSRGSIYATWVE